MAHRIQRQMIWAAGAILLTALWPAWGLAQSTAQGSSGALSGIKTVDIPNGGHIYMGVLAGQPTPVDALGKTLHQVDSLCGDRPQLGKQVKNTTGEILAGFFTVTGKKQDGKPMAGLAIVYAPKSGSAGGAVLMDYADRFPATVNSMFTRLKQELGISPASPSGRQASAGGAAAPAKGTSPVKSAQVPTLQPAVFPDGTGVIGLPEGWQMMHAHMGDVSASGPKGEKLRFGWTIAVMDPTNPQSRALLGNNRGAAPGNFVAIPYGSDPASAYKSAVSQLMRKSGKPAPEINILKVQEISMQGGKNYMLYGNMDGQDNQGKQYLVAQMINTMPLTMGTWQMTLFVMYGPEQVMGEEAATISAIFPNYSRNSKLVNKMANAQIAEGIVATNQFVNQVQREMDSTDRMAAGMSNMLRDQTVIVDTRTGGHATTSDDLAGALINANPSRFQSVSPSGYISGIDY